MIDKRKEEFYNYLFGHSMDNYKDYDNLWKIVNQNYISKQRILNLECLKEEKIEIPEKYEEFTLEFGKNRRNELRNQIKSEIEKL